MLMHKFICILLIGYICGGCVSTKHENRPKHQINDNGGTIILGLVDTDLSEQSDRYKRLGSAVAINKLKQEDGSWLVLAVTCKHVVEVINKFPKHIFPGLEFAIFDGNDILDGTYKHAELVAVSKNSDLALITYITKSPPTVYVLSLEDVDPNTPVSISTIPAPFINPIVTTGRVISSDIPGLPSTIAVGNGIHAYPGCSGGGLFHDNKLIGIVMGLYKSGGGDNGFSTLVFAVDNKELFRFILSETKKLKKD